jgi:hypothetical protein
MGKGENKKMSKHRRRPCSHLEQVYKRAFEIALERLDIDGSCMSAHRYCDDGSGRKCIECNRVHIIERAEREVEND